MFNFFNNKFEFACLFEQVKNTYPIVPAKKVRKHWFKNSVDAYKKTVFEKGNFQQVSGTAKCPGINSIINEGYILRSWFDLTIESFDNDYELSYNIPQGMDNFCRSENFTKSLISWFPGDMEQIAVPVKKTSMKTLFKITTPWAVSIPKGWKLLIMPVAYNDDNRFTSTSGILKSGPYCQINPVIEWHVKESKECIKSGTPLCQLIPIRDTDPKVEIKVFDEKFHKHDKQTDYDLSHSYVRK